MVWRLAFWVRGPGSIRELSWVQIRKLRPCRHTAQSKIRQTIRNNHLQSTTVAGYSPWGRKSQIQLNH